MPDVFPWLQKLGNIDHREMFKVFNCGIGMIVVGENLGAIADCIRQEHETAIPLGRVESHNGKGCVKIGVIDKVFDR
jgi:phosphoribosylformylglycinamidine cyclo-ligase